MLTSLHEASVKPRLLEKATARRTAHRVMAKKKRKGSDKKQKASRSRQGKQRQERRDGWTTRRRQVAPPPYVSPPGLWQYGKDARFYADMHNEMANKGALPAKGKEYPGLGYKRVRDKPPKAQQQQQQPAEAQ
ncbi:hypothetical protein QJQ45_001386 [Haematococcus lacustris]|nr:hypothetical protein QJQ45_001386 [Haematococcus lacustris]